MMSVSAMYCEHFELMTCIALLPTAKTLSRWRVDSYKLAAGSGSRGRSRLAVGCPAESLLDERCAFYEKYEYCGNLDGGVEGDRVWMRCTCGAVINRAADRD